MSEPRRVGLLSKLYTVIRGLAIVSPWLVHLLVADVALSLLLPVTLAAPSSGYNVASIIAKSVWVGIQEIFTRVNGARLTFSGVKLPEGESAIVVCNHVEWADFYMIHALAIKAGMLGRCRWFAKQQLKWVPFLGWGLWAMRMPLVSRKWLSDQKELERVFHGIVKNHWPIWLISYSEATRYTRAKYHDTLTWCKENDKPIPKHTLYPRTRGFLATVSQLRHTPHVRAVYDVTIAYAHGKTFMEAPSFWQTVSQPKLDKDWRFHVHVDRYTLKELPDTDEELAKWLEARWMEKGDRLEILRDALMKDEEWPPEELQEKAL
ncbi:MAG: hypothetical protein M1820_003379 [Bogoriella megaspora]|nr:MAG: hypothetical protein M1820_003379 [Bogoriella megaspora]